MPTKAELKAERKRQLAAAAGAPDSVDPSFQPPAPILPPPRPSSPDGAVEGGKPLSKSARKAALLQRLQAAQARLEAAQSAASQPMGGSRAVSPSAPAATSKLQRKLDAAARLRERLTTNTFSISSSPGSKTPSDLAQDPTAAPLLPRSDRARRKDMVARQIRARLADHEAVLVARSTALTDNLNEILQDVALVDPEVLAYARRLEADKAVPRGDRKRRIAEELARRMAAEGSSSTAVKGGGGGAGGGGGSGGGGGGGVNVSDRKRALMERFAAEQRAHEEAMKTALIMRGKERDAGLEVLEELVVDVDNDVDDEGGNGNDAGDGDDEGGADDAASPAGGSDRPRGKKKVGNKKKGKAGKGPSRAERKAAVATALRAALASEHLMVTEVGALLAGDVAGAESRQRRKDVLRARLKDRMYAAERAREEEERRADAMVKKEIEMLMRSDDADAEEVGGRRRAGSAASAEPSVADVELTRAMAMLLEENEDDEAKGGGGDGGRRTPTSPRQPRYVRKRRVAELLAQQVKAREAESGPLPARAIGGGVQAAPTATATTAVAAAGGVVTKDQRKKLLAVRLAAEADAEEARWKASAKAHRLHEEKMLKVVQGELEQLLDGASGNSGLRGRERQQLLVNGFEALLASELFHSDDEDGHHDEGPDPAEEEDHQSPLPTAPSTAIGPVLGFGPVHGSASSGGGGGKAQPQRAQRKAELKRALQAQLAAHQELLQRSGKSGGPDAGRDGIERQGSITGAADAVTLTPVMAEYLEQTRLADARLAARRARGVRRRSIPTGNAAPGGDASDTAAGSASPAANGTGGAAGGKGAGKNREGGGGKARSPRATPAAASTTTAATSQQSAEHVAWLGWLDEFGLSAADEDDPQFGISAFRRWAEKEEGRYRALQAETDAWEATVAALEAELAELEREPDDEGGGGDAIFDAPAFFDDDGGVASAPTKPKRGPIIENGTGGRGGRGRRGDGGGGGGRKGGRGRGKRKETGVGEGADGGAGGRADGGGGRDESFHDGLATFERELLRETGYPGGAGGGRGRGGRGGGGGERVKERRNSSSNSSLPRDDLFGLYAGDPAGAARAAADAAAARRAFKGVGGGGGGGGQVQESGLPSLGGGGGGAGLPMIAAGGRSPVVSAPPTILSHTTLASVARHAPAQPARYDPLAAARNRALGRV